MNPSIILLSAGIFVTLAFIIITYILTKLELGVGIWPILSAVALFLTLSVYFEFVISNVWMTQLSILVAMLLFVAAALIKFWDILGYMRRYA